MATGPLQYHTVRLSHDATLFSSNNLTCPENTVYDTVSSALRMSSQAKVTHSENFAYTSFSKTGKDPIRNTTTSHTTVYEEVTLK